MFKSKITEIGIYFPSTVLTIEEVEEQIQSPEDSKIVSKGLVKRLTGVETVHRAADNEQTSDLAVSAVKELIRNSNPYKTVEQLKPDLLIFASASQDMIEPATSHIISAKLGFDCPVMDVKNACNSVLNGMQVADSLIQTGAYKRILIVSGEKPSGAIRYNIPDRETFVTSFPGFSMSDAGAAVLIEQTNKDDSSHINSFSFTAKSEAWDVGMLRMGGSYAPRDIEMSYFYIHGDKLFDAFDSLGSDFLNKALHESGKTWDDFTFIGTHQVALPYLETIKHKLGIPEGKANITIKQRGNIASCTLPAQIVQALQTGQLKKGDDYALIGLAGGISIGLMTGTW